MTRRYAFKPAESLARDADLTLQMTPLTPIASVASACKPDPIGLYWFSDLTGAFDQDVEAAYLLMEGAAGPLLGIAQVLGETCDDVTWTTAWTPASGAGGAPGLVEEGANLIVYPLADTQPGILTVSARCAGQAFGPILLTVLRYACYAYYAPCTAPENALGGWLRVPDNFVYSSYTGPLGQYGGAEGTVQIGAFAVTTLNFGNMPGVAQLWIYCNDGGDGYFVVNGDGISRRPARGPFAGPWQSAEIPVVSVTGLTSLELHSDGYNAPFYLFVK